MTTRSETQRIRAYQHLHSGMSYMQARRELSAPVALDIGTQTHPLLWQPPGLIGIVGEPGSGKTAHLSRIQQRLAGREVFVASNDDSVSETISRALATGRDHETFVMIDNLPERIEGGLPADIEAVKMLAHMSRSTQTYLIYTTMRPDMVHPVIMAFTTALVACAGEGVIRPQHEGQRVVSIESAH